MKKETVKKEETVTKTAATPVKKLELRRVIGGAGRRPALQSVGAKAASCTEVY